jgi:hypothetical protein
MAAPRLSPYGLQGNFAFIAGELRAGVATLRIPEKSPINSIPAALPRLYCEK